jgi:hypothetical protein
VKELTSADYILHISHIIEYLSNITEERIPQGLSNLHA